MSFQAPLWETSLRVHYGKSLCSATIEMGAGCQGVNGAPDNPAENPRVAGVLFSNYRVREQESVSQRLMRVGHSLFTLKRTLRFATRLCTSLSASNRASGWLEASMIREG
jgi:hypothetical protein